MLEIAGYWRASSTTVSNRNLVYEEQAFKNALQFMKRIAQDGIMGKEIKDMSVVDAKEKFNKNEAAMFLGGHWDSGTFKKDESWRNNIIWFTIPPLPNQRIKDDVTLPGEGISGVWYAYTICKVR